MKSYELLDAVGDIDEKYIADAEKGKNVKKHKIIIKRLLLAACLGLVIVITLAGAAIIAEANEYKKAVEFFNSNGLSTEGLSRSEVKEVYRDISTKSFTYEKTAEVLSKTISGYEIIENDQGSITPEELEKMWEKQTGIASSVKICKTDYVYIPDKEKGIEVLEKCVLTCSENGKELWKAELYEIIVEGYAFTSSGTAVWGTNSFWVENGPTHSFLSLIDENGSIVWTKKLEHNAMKWESISEVLENSDGTLAVFSRVDFKALNLSRFNTDGSELYSKMTEVGNLGIRNAALFGDGYLVQLWNTSTNDTARIVKLDSDGTVVDDYIYESDDCDYYITDMIEFGDQVYLSAYSVPKQTDEGGRDEIGNILKTLFKDHTIYNIPDKELTSLLRDNYTAVLLCDPDGGEPKTFYSVKGSLGGKLAVSEAGKLEWDAESIVSAYFSPYTNSFTIGGTCRVYRYAFDDNGQLV
ncbi:MAG: hypothetical protein IJS94_09240, partial [Clostridia bacterium]|nr:hypothetical protein [Clostridia bacterium]